ncbi:MAG: hypothetical protein AAFQ75_05360, partial [Pseudomonadota bacterium]
MSATSSKPPGPFLPAACACAATVLVLHLFAGPAGAQSLTLDLGPEPEGAAEGTLTGRVIQLFMIVTVLSLAPGIAIMITCFPFMITVLSIL